MINWFYHLTLDISLLIGLVLILRPFIRRVLGANVAYWLWTIPLVRCFAWVKLDRSVVLMESVIMPESDVLIRIFPNPKAYILSNSVPYLEILVLGMIIWLLIRFIGWFRFNVVLKNNSKKITLNDVLNNHITSKGYHSKTSFYITNLPEAPFVTGFFSPKVYLPGNFYSNYPIAQQQFILQHELAHLKRKDIWMQLLAELVRTVFWFNPVVHIAWNAFREDQELACDHTVLKTTNSQERYEYGHALMQGFHAHAFPAVMAFYNNHKERFIMLEKHTNSTKNTLVGISLCMILGIFALTKSPEIIANEESDPVYIITLNYFDIPLRPLLKLVFNQQPKEVVGMDLIPNTNVSISATQVGAKQIASVLLNCYGLNLINEKEKLSIVKSKNLENESVNLECVLQHPLNHFTEKFPDSY